MQNNKLFSDEHGLCDTTIRFHILGNSIPDLVSLASPNHVFAEKTGFIRYRYWAKVGIFNSHYSSNTKKTLSRVDASKKLTHEWNLQQLMQTFSMRHCHLSSKAKRQYFKDRWQTGIRIKQIVNLRTSLMRDDPENRFKIPPVYTVIITICRPYGGYSLLFVGS